jgi:PleD family two-component response regulator
LLAVARQLLGSSWGDRPQENLRFPYIESKFDRYEENSAELRREDPILMILIVDDDPAVTTLLRMSFELEGHVVVTASNGAEALDLARQIHPAAMVVDVMMPGWMGWS